MPSTYVLFVYVTFHVKSSSACSMMGWGASALIGKKPTYACLNNTLDYVEKMMIFAPRRLIPCRISVKHNAVVPKRAEHFDRYSSYHDMISARDCFCTLQPFSRLNSDPVTHPLIVSVVLSSQMMTIDNTRIVAKTLKGGESNIRARSSVE